MNNETNNDSAVHASNKLTASHGMTEQRRLDSFIREVEAEEETVSAGSEAHRLQMIRRDKQAAAAQRIAQVTDVKQIKSRLKVQHRTRRKSIPSPLPWGGQEPSFRIATNGGFFGIDSIHPKDLVHVLAIGGTGSGKTVSSVLPLLNAQLRYSLPTDTGFKRSSLLVIDPKRELLANVQSVLASQGESERLILLGGVHRSCAVKFFAIDENLTNREKLAKIDVVLGTVAIADGNHSYWHASGMQVLERFMNLEEAYRVVRKKSLVNLWVAKNNPDAKSKAQSPASSFWVSLLSILNSTRAGKPSFRWANTNLKDLLKEADLKEHPDASVMDAFQEETDLMQWQYRVQSADPVIRLLADPEIARSVDMDPFPSTNAKSLDLRDVMDAGLVVLFQPSPEPNSALAARAIKAQWYSAVRNRRDMARPVGVVVDEFQRFVTLDEASGDANFLDVARGYRCNCVFATQSLEALLNALKSSRHAESAVDSIVANTPSKFFFASKDLKTEAVMRNLIPSAPGSGPHIVTARPPALLKAGEAYWSLADGRWGRGRARIESFC
jgi:hypothetical protein